MGWLKPFRGDSDQFTIRGKRVRRQTTLIKFGKHSVSKKALELGLLIIVCQIFDGLLTYIGLWLLGVRMEGNRFLRELMYSYGTAPVLVFIKFGAIIAALPLIFYAHSRKWFRPVLGLIILIYLSLAVIPWIYIISNFIHSGELH